MGYVVWQGPSRLNRAPVVVIATGVDTPTVNPKTGSMVQVWILLQQEAPHVAVRNGTDGGICGGCALRGNHGAQRACYVQVHQAPLTIWRQWHAGHYRPCADDAARAAVGAGRAVRLGAYGDPAAVPLAVWDALLRQAAGWTGYSHQWRSPRLADVMRYCLASCETEADVRAAQALGFGTYRVRPRGTLPLADEVECPSSLGVQCVTCLRCAGAGQHVTIPAHGRGARWLNATANVDLIQVSGDFGAQIA